MKQHYFRNYFIAGLLVWIPIAVTFFVIRFIFHTMDGTLSLLPEAYRPDQLLGVHIPGLGLIISLLVVLATGVLARNVLGKKLVGIGERIVSKIPLVRSIYLAVKQVMETLFHSSSQAFRKVLLVEYPRKGLWSIAFQTATVTDELKQKSNQDLVTIFVPTTPNPTSGFLMMIPRADAIELDMSVDEALKMVISLGVMQPGMAVNGDKAPAKS